MLKKMDNVGYFDIESGVELTKKQVSDISREDNRVKIKHLNNKFDKNEINKDELKELMRIMNKNPSMCLNYESFFKVNMCKNKPEGISDSDYGKFFRLLRYLSFRNKITHKANGKPIKKQDLCLELGFTNIRSFNNYLRKLNNNKMVAESSSGNVKFLFINPAYAQRNMIVNSTIFSLFKDDLVGYFDKYEIKLLELEDEEVDIQSVVVIES